MDIIMKHKRADIFQSDRSFSDHFFDNLIKLKFAILGDEQFILRQFRKIDKKIIF